MINAPRRKVSVFIAFRSLTLWLSSFCCELWLLFERRLRVERGKRLEMSFEDCFECVLSTEREFLRLSCAFVCVSLVGVTTISGLLIAISSPEQKRVLY